MTAQVIQFPALRRSADGTIISSPSNEDGSSNRRGRLGFGSAAEVLGPLKASDERNRPALLDVFSLDRRRAAIELASGPDTTPPAA